ncbi:MAG TPA: hypothetical protein VN033_04205 [Vulgatibacter sp.]|nr:hypothetical protein [Vulgatibacter sp.]
MRFPLILAAWMAATPAIAAKPAAALGPIRVEARGTRTVVELEGAGPTAFTTSFPERGLIVDLFAADLGAGCALPEPAGAVESVRCSRRGGGVRIEVALRAEAEARFEIRGGTLRIDFGPGLDAGAGAVPAAEAAALAKAEEERRAAEAAARAEAEAQPMVLARAGGGPDARAPSSAGTGASAAAGAGRGATIAAASGRRAPAPSTSATGPVDVSHLGFQPTQGGARVSVRVDARPRWRVVERSGLVVLEIQGGRLPRPNDRRAIDASFFGTPVGLIKPVEDRRSGAVRIEIALRRKVPYTVSVGDDALVIEFAG